MSRRAGIVVFSRMSSARLPGKALADFGGMPLLAWALRRARSLAYPVFLATSDDPSDAPLVELAAAEGIASYRGALADVLGRALGAAEAFDLDPIVRLCGDRPYFDLDDMARAVEIALAEPSLDLISTWLPGVTAVGLTTEVIARAALTRAATLAREPAEREHLTSWLYQPAAQARIRHLPAAAHGLRAGYAVDTAADLARLYPNPEWAPSVPRATVSARVEA